MEMKQLKTIRWLFLVLGLAIGFSISFFVGYPFLESLLELNLSGWQYLGAITLGTLITGLIFFIISPGVIRQVVRTAGWIESRLSKSPLEDIVIGTAGLVAGLVISLLVGPSLAHVPLLGGILPILGTILLAYLGIAISLKKKEDLLKVFPFLPRSGESVPTEFRRGVEVKILDTSVIIDGRVADIVHSGFLEGKLIVPSFVLEELQHIADSSDVLKRNRGRRGLDILNRLQKENPAQIEIYEGDFDGEGGVDAKLVRLAKSISGKILTNDYNLNKVAEFQGVIVLNINELANALKPVVLPGEEMTVQVIKDGKESGQGIGYLDDGTMIVVDGGKSHIGETIRIMVTSVLQTAAGRMIFAKPKAVEKIAP